MDMFLHWVGIVDCQRPLQSCVRVAGHGYRNAIEEIDFALGVAQAK